MRGERRWKWKTPCQKPVWSSLKNLFLSVLQQSDGPLPKEKKKQKNLRDASKEIKWKEIRRNKPPTFFLNSPIRRPDNAVAYDNFVMIEIPTEWILKLKYALKSRISIMLIYSLLHYAEAQKKQTSTGLHTSPKATLYRYIGI